MPFLPPYTYMASAAPAANTHWDKWTAIGTLLLAAVTFATLVFAVVDAAFARRRAAEDREAADKRLEDERKAGNQRIEAERRHEADLRRRERQVDRASALVGRIARLQEYLNLLPGAALRGEWGLNSPSLQSRMMVGQEALIALSSLRHGAWTEAAMLGMSLDGDQAAGRYTTLVRLADEAALTADLSERDKTSLRNYARWVLLSMRALTQEHDVPMQYERNDTYPKFGKAEHEDAWLPMPIPPGWDDMAEADPPEHRSKRIDISWNTDSTPAQPADDNGQARSS
jgi:hypothetical protein